MGIKTVAILGMYIYLCLSAIHALSFTCIEVKENRTVDCEVNTTHSVSWLYKRKMISSCYSGTCYPSSWDGRNFSFTGIVHKITISNYTLDDCAMYDCKDLVSSDYVTFPYCPVPVKSINMTKPTSDKLIEIIEGTMAEFHCRTSSSYPAAIVSWYKDATPGVPGGVVPIKDNITSNSVKTGVDLEEVTKSILHLYPSRVDSGHSIYCSANNTSVHIISKSRPIIKVLYAPIPLNTSQLSTNLSSRVHDQVRFEMEISADPYPQPSDYVWWNYEGDQWKRIEDSLMVRILTKPPWTSLVLVNVQISEFGEYKLEVKNSVGLMEQTFTLIPYDVPYPPIGLSYYMSNNESMLQWQPGFDGGLQQTFVVQLRKQSTDCWIERNVILADKSETHLSLNLSFLDDGTNYTARIYAFNSVGNSAVTQGKSFMTRGTLTSDTDTVSSCEPSFATIGGVVGGGVLVIVCVAFVVIFVVRKGFCSNHQNVRELNDQQKSETQPRVNDEHAFSDQSGMAVQTQQNSAEPSGYEELGSVREHSDYLMLHAAQGNEEGIPEMTVQTYENTKLS